MLLTVEDMIKTLRQGVNILDVDGETDPVYNEMTDEDILLFIKMAVSRDYPDIDDLNDLPNGCEYGVILLAKIELYMKLAVAVADQFDIGADNNNYLKRSQRFEHYKALAEEARAEYEDYSDDSVSTGGVQTYDVLLNSRHYTRRNYNFGIKPRVSLKVSQITNNSIEFAWSVSKSDYFGAYKVFIGEEPIIDQFKDGANLENKITEKAKLIKSTYDIRDCFHRIEGLKPNTSYYLAVFSQERNGIYGYKEITFTTLEEVGGEEVSVSSL